MTEPVLIGTYGWEYDAWEPDFYPPELPRDWRFCFFSNKIRAVIVPAGAWLHIGPGVASQWAEDSDPGFRFVLEVPINAEGVDPVGALDRLLADGGALRERVAALLVPIAMDVPIARLDALLASVAGRYPVCIEARPDQLTSPLKACLASHGASLCWFPDQQDDASPDGEFLVALMGDAEPRAIRRVLEHLEHWKAGKKNAGLFFRNGHAPRSAGQARVIAELMGI